MPRIAAHIVACFVLLSGVLVAAAPVLALDGDPAKGREIYTRCMACHSIDANLVGPKHRGLFGRKAGSVPGFDYSTALKNSGIVWNADTLNQWIKDPNKLVPGNRMFVRLVPDDQERADLIAYLKIATAPTQESAK